MAHFGYATPETGTDQELLELCRQQQAKILASMESYSTQDFSAARTKLKELREYEKDLLSTINAAGGSTDKTNYAARQRAV